MNINDIKSIAEIMVQNGLSLVEFEEKGIKLKIEKAFSQTASVPVTIPEIAPVEVVKTETVKVETQDGNIVTSPTVGVYYSSSSPDTAPYVSMGSKVKTGDTLCIIEAMKLMNEITSEFDGEIVEVYVGNGQVVEFGQPLFKIK